MVRERERGGKREREKEKERETPPNIAGADCQKTYKYVLH